MKYNWLGTYRLEDPVPFTGAEGRHQYLQVHYIIIVIKNVKFKAQ